MEPDTSTGEPLQPQWHVYMGQELGQQPAHAGTAQGSELPCTVPTALPGLCSTESPSSASPGVTDPAANTPLPAGHSCNTNTPAVPAPSKEQQVLTVRALSSAFQEKALFSSH